MNPIIRRDHYLQKLIDRTPAWLFLTVAALVMVFFTLMTMSEMVMRASNTVEAAGNALVVADADTGFGNAVNVQRTIREYEKAGVAVIQLEDQVMPKPSGRSHGRDGRQGQGRR